MHNQNLVVAVKHREKVLREHGSTVYLPFGSNYSLLIKNLDSVSKASVNVEIDGEDVLNNRSLIVDSNDYVELKRFINSSLDKGNRFKFIEATDRIRENREDNSINGIIKVTYRFERKYDVEEWVKKDVPQDWEADWTTGTQSDNYELDYNTVTYSANNCLRSQSFNEEGITAPGEIVDQKFRVGDIGPLEFTKHTITLQLKGKNLENENIEKPLTTDDKIECSSCGRKQDSNYKYCPQCGTALVVI